MNATHNLSHAQAFDPFETPEFKASKAARLNHSALQTAPKTLPALRPKADSTDILRYAFWFSLAYSAIAVAINQAMA